MVFEVEWRRERSGRQKCRRRRKVEGTAVVRMVMVITPEQVSGRRCTAVEHERRGCCVVGHAWTAGGAPVGHATAADCRTTA